MKHLLLAILTICFASTSADALVLCAKKDKATGAARNGSSIKLRESCKSREVELNASDLGVRTPPTLTDADDKIVGTVTDIEDNGEIVTFLTPSAATTCVGNTSSTIIAPGLGGAYFESEDCSGQALGYLVPDSAVQRCINFYSGGDGTPSNHATATVLGPSADAASEVTVFSFKTLPDGACIGVLGGATDTFGPLVEIGTFRPPLRVVASDE